MGNSGASVVWLLEIYFYRKKGKNSPLLIWLISAQLSHPSSATIVFIMINGEFKREWLIHEEDHTFWLVKVNFVRKFQWRGRGWFGSQREKQKWCEERRLPFYGKRITSLTMKMNFHLASFAFLLFPTIILDINLFAEDLIIFEILFIYYWWVLLSSWLWLYWHFFVGFWWKKMFSACGLLFLGEVLEYVQNFLSLPSSLVKWKS